MKIIVHCSASDFGTAVMIDRWHRERGWAGIGYHVVIENGYPSADHKRTGMRVKLLNGSVSSGREIDADADLDSHERGAHAYGFNKDTLAICMIGDTHFTKQQIISLVKVVKLFEKQFKIDADVDQFLLGHCELPNVVKTCPNIDMNVIRELVRVKNVAFDLMRSLPNLKEVF